MIKIELKKLAENFEICGLELRIAILLNNNPDLTTTDISKILNKNITNISRSKTKLKKIGAI